MLIIVTGASRGIGFEAVKELIARQGLMVLAVSRKTASLEKLAGATHRLLPLRADISSPEGIRAVVSVVKRLEMPVAGLVNNAAKLLKKEFGAIKASELGAVYETNVFAPFLLVQSLLPYLRAGAHVLNISSMGGVAGSAKFPGLSAYSSSKAALCGLTECLAEELRPKDIRVNALALGAVQTEMLAEAFPGYRAPLSAAEMGSYVAEFVLKGHRFFNGKILPVSVSTP